MIESHHLDTLPTRRPKQSGHPWFVWFHGQVNLDAKLACDVLGCEYQTLQAKMSCIRRLTTAELYALVDAWVRRGRHVTLAQIGELVLIHGKINASKNSKG